MILLWPLALVSLGGVVGIMALYVWAQKRRRRGVRYSATSLLREVLPHPSRRRHIPFGLFTVALAVLAIGAARPAVELPLPVGTSAMILAFDTSGSMCGDRLQAAKNGAAAFALRHAATRKVGVVSFASSALVVALPTNDPDTLIGAIDQLEGHGGTKMDLGILRAIDAIAENNPRVAPTDAYLPGVAPAYVADVIVILSDGASDTDTTKPAEAAAARGIRIYPIAYTMPVGAGCRAAFNTSPNVVGLQAIAEKTGGEFREAGTADELNAVFDGLPTYLWVEVEQVEVSVAFAAVGAALAFAALLLGRLWAPLP